MNAFFGGDGDRCFAFGADRFLSTDLERSPFVALRGDLDFERPLRFETTGDDFSRLSLDLSTAGERDFERFLLFSVELGSLFECDLSCDDFLLRSLRSTDLVLAGDDSRLRDLPASRP